MEQLKLNQYFDYSLEPHRAILFQDVKSNYGAGRFPISIEKSI